MGKRWQLSLKHKMVLWLGIDGDSSQWIFWKTKNFGVKQWDRISDYFYERRTAHRSFRGYWWRVDCQYWHSQTYLQYITTKLNTKSNNKSNYIDVRYWLNPNKWFRNWEPVTQLYTILHSCFHNHTCTYHDRLLLEQVLQEIIK